MKFSILTISLAALVTSIHAAPTANADPVEAAALIPRSSLCGFAATLQTRACKRSAPVDDAYESGPCSWSGSPTDRKRNPACKRSEPVDDAYESGPCSWSGSPKDRKRNPACKAKRSADVDKVFISGPCAWAEKKARSDEIIERIPEAFGLKMSKRDLELFADILEERSAEC